MGHRTVTIKQAGEQMPMPVRCEAQREQVGGAAGSTQAFLETARASSKTCAGKAMEQKGEGEQREKRPESVRLHFVLSARDSFFFLVLLLL